MNGDGVCQRGEEWQARVWGSQKSWVLFFQCFSVAGEKTSIATLRSIEGCGSAIVLKRSINSYISYPNSPEEFAEKEAIGPVGSVE